MRRRRAGVPAAATAGILGALLLAAPAGAHVSVSADNPQAGAADVTVTFTGEAESDRAGISSERVVLPTGISPADVRLATAPPGWALATNPDGYTVSGPALPVGRDAVHSVLLKRLPQADELVFKVLEGYGDGSVSRWIEVPRPGQPEPANPAPVLRLKPAASSQGGGSAGPTVTATPPATPATSAPDQGDKDNSGGNAALWWTLGVLAVLVVSAVGFWWWRRRRARRPPTGS